MYIVASDFDGTLSYHGVSQENKDAIKRFRAAGNQFGLVTGRDYWMYNTLKHENIEFDFVISFNGGMAIKEDGSLYYCEKAPNVDNVIRKIAEYLGNTYHTFLGCALDRERHEFCVDPSYAHHPTILPEEADKLEAFTQLNTVCPSDEAAAAAAAEVNRRWGKIIKAVQNGWAVDFIPVDVDKGEGLARYAKMIGVPDDHVYAVGDNLNDLPMITRFHGCAVANAREEVKAAAEATYEGVWAVIDHVMSLDK